MAAGDKVVKYTLRNSFPYEILLIMKSKHAPNYR